MPANQLRRRMHPVVRHHATPASKGPRILGAGSIALISLAAVLTLRGFPSVAEYGWSSIAFYVLGALFFLIPLALVAAELATGWPRAGGVYAWVKEAFGDHSGFVAVWFEWVEDVVWFPPVLSFVAATLAYAFDPGLASNKLYLVIVMLAVFWGLTLANFFGMKWTARLNNPGVLFGNPAASDRANRAGRLLVLVRAHARDPVPRQQAGTESRQRQPPGVLRRGAVGVRWHRDGWLSRKGDSQPRTRLSAGDFHGGRSDHRLLDPRHVGDRLCRAAGQAQSRLLKTPCLQGFCVVGGHRQHYRA